jgi:hypothetical protein
MRSITMGTEKQKYNKNKTQDAIIEMNRTILLMKFQEMKRNNICIIGIKYKL